MTTTRSDAELARDLATRAGDLLTELRPTLVDAENAERQARGDRAAQDFLAAELAVHRPGDCVLSEEALDDARRLTADRVWIIDPLDGTREYAIDGRSDWAVHVALWERTADSGAGALTAGAVALPGLDTTLATDDPPIVPARPQPTGPVRIVVSASRPPKALEVVAAALDVVPVQFGSAGAKVGEVLLGRADAYVHDGGLNQWDTAAPVVVAQAAGLHVSHLDGTPLLFNGSDTVSGSIVVCRPELAGSILAVLAGAVPGA